MAQQQCLPFAGLQALAATSSYRDSSPTNSEFSTTPSEESAGTEGEPSTRGPNELRRKRTNKSNQQKPRTSWVFNHMRDEDREKRYLSDNGTLEWRCKYCTQTYELSGGTYIITKRKLTVDDLRSRLGGDTIEALECLRSWLKIKDTEIESLIQLAAKLREDEDPVPEKGKNKESIDEDVIEPVD